MRVWDGDLTSTFCTFTTKTSGASNIPTWRNAYKYIVGDMVRCIYSETTELSSKDLKRNDKNWLWKGQKTKQKLHKHFCHPTPCVGKYRAWLIQKTKTDNHRKRRQGESNHRNDNMLCWIVPVVHLAMQLTLNTKLCIIFHPINTLKIMTEFQVWLQTAKMNHTLLLKRLRQLSPYTQ